MERPERLCFWIRGFWCVLSVVLDAVLTGIVPEVKDYGLLTKQTKTRYQRACKPLLGEFDINYSSLADVLRSKICMSLCHWQWVSLLINFHDACWSSRDIGAFTGVINLGLSSSQPLWKRLFHSANKATPARHYKCLQVNNLGSRAISVLARTSEALLAGKEIEAHI